MNDDGNQSPRLDPRATAIIYGLIIVVQYPHQYLIGQQLFDLLN